LDEVQLGQFLAAADSHYNFEAESLQKKLLHLLRAEVNTANAEDLLQSAETSRLRCLRQIRRQVVLGLHAANKEIHQHVEGFSDFEIYVLNQAAQSNDPNNYLKSSVAIEVISKKLREGKGIAAIAYLAARLNHQGRRLHQSGRVEVFDPHLLVIAMLWTDPNCPLWLMPAAGAVSVINRILNGVEPGMTKENFNRAVKQHNVTKLSPKSNIRLITTLLRSFPLLGGQLQEAMGLELRALVPGRRARRS
jgi:hypothetical protein